MIDDEWIENFKQELYQTKSLNRCDSVDSLIDYLKKRFNRLQEKMNDELLQDGMSFKKDEDSNFFFYVFDRFLEIKKDRHNYAEIFSGSGENTEQIATVTWVNEIPFIQWIEIKKLDAERDFAVKKDGVFLTIDQLDNLLAKAFSIS